ncbi:translation initiation factor IF-2 [Ruminococcus sp. FMB-CY1]|uniref:translation initiation factor IF-2 n=1 Tax=unclassified Ruminococcus TaxID=2608920 RepID=UPI00208F2BE2|nr:MULTISPECIES: translation initiation factor IF-2 [unclassified Ruminococcus]USP68820.1 translation initiation factor IF-2 [Ruminococcus sp. FMBCY1]WBX57878.1 translation initiation factor IF-2 [Ruminococcus sp. FMB-CY1]
MIKYKVRDVAKDLGVSVKEISDILEKNCGVTKKAMATLEESELNIVFDAVTQKNNVANFDKFFASRNKTAEPAKTEVKAEKKANNKDSKDNKPNGRKNDRKSDNKDNKAEGKKQNKVQDKPAKQTKAEPKAESKPVEITSEEETSTRKRRVIDTRAVNVDVERYNQKYDDLANASSKMRSTDNTVKKQKFTNRSQKQKGRRQGKRETEQERLKRIALERKQKQMTIQIPDEIVVQELALRLKATVAEVVKKAFLMGTMVTATDTIDFDTASLIAMEFHAKVEKEVVVTIEERIIDDSEDDDTNLVERAPVVVVMGHVDHGKTSILDAIRHANVTAGEAGGITQHIGAYRVEINGKPITFLDTPGHEAFTTMRARGAQVTDIAILVVAADDGIMPQTVEAINHAKAAGVSVIVAINKMDKVGANPENVKQQLTEYELVPEEWGGDTPCIPVSAKTKEGLDDLLEMVTLIAEMKELKANPDRAAKGTVIEARLDKGRGPIATVLVQNGTLHQGDIVIAGTCVGRVRVMVNDKGERVKEAGPSVPVEITGLAEVPQGGDIFNAVSDEKLARELVEQRKASQKEEQFKAQTKVTLDNLFDQMKLGEVKELQIIVKADVQGSVEAVKQSLEKLSNDEVRVNVIHGGVGAINESDVMLAEASNAIIVGFNVRPDSVAAANAESAGVDMRLYRIIYDCIEEIEAAMKGMLAPKTREVVLGTAECRNVIKIKSVGTISGSYVKSGKIVRNAGVRVIRDGIVIAEDTIASLQRFKDAVKEVNEGYECGIGLERFNDIKEGDLFEAYTIEEYRD